MRGAESSRLGQLVAAVPLREELALLRELMVAQQQPRLEERQVPFAARQELRQVAQEDPVQVLLLPDAIVQDGERFQTEFLEIGRQLQGLGEELSEDEQCLVKHRLVPQQRRYLDLRCDSPLQEVNCKFE